MVRGSIPENLRTRISGRPNLKNRTDHRSQISPEIGKHCSIKYIYLRAFYSPVPDFLPRLEGGDPEAFRRVRFVLNLYL